MFLVLKPFNIKHKPHHCFCYCS